MLNSLKNHPFGVQAHFDYSLVLTFAFDQERLRHLIPEHLELDTHQDRWAFVAVAAVQTRQLRPMGFPVWLGNDFLLIGYRIFVRYMTKEGKRLRGLYILKSETDKSLMTMLGNLITHYNYAKVDVKAVRESSKLSWTSSQSGFMITVHQHEGNVDLPISSPFTTWKEARRYAGPLPFTFTYFTESKQMLLVEGVRENWTPQPVEVISYQLPYLASIGLTGGILANAFIIKDIPYHWKKGRIEQW